MLNQIRKIFSPGKKIDNEATTLSISFNTYTEEMLQDVVDAIVNGLGFRAAMIALVENRLDDSNNQQSVISVRGFATDINIVPGGDSTLLAWGEKITGEKLIGNYVALTVENEAINKAVRAIRENKDYVIVDNLHELFAPVLNKTKCDLIQATAGLKSFVTVPFRNKDGQLIGNLYAGHTGKEITSDMIRRLNAFSTMAVTALHNAFLYQNNVRTTGREEILKTTITKLLTVTLDTQQLLNDIAESVVMTMGFRACMVAIVEQKGEKSYLTVVSYKFLPGIQELLGWGEKLAGMKLAGQTLELNESNARVNIAVRAIMEDKPHDTTDRLGDLFAPTLNNLISDQLQRAFKIKELVTVPLRNRQGQLRGNMYASSSKSISPSEIDELKTFALAASIAIDNANQYQKTENLYRESRRMGLFAANFGHVTHKINNMLGGVRLILEREIQKPQSNLTDKQRLRLNDANAQVVSSLAIIKELNQRVRNEPEIPVNITNSLKTAIKMLSSGKFGYKLPEGIKINLNTDVNNITVLAHEDLSEIFRTIMKNGCEAMGEQGILTVSAKTIQIDERAFAEVTIADTGPGIPGNKLEHLFELKESESSKYGSMGYGIWAAHLTIQWYDGNLTYESCTQAEIDSNSEELAGQKPGTKAMIHLPLHDPNHFGIAEEKE